MSELQEVRTIQRILVALDASTDSLAALDAAAKLAARLNAELVGLFVEDVNLLYMAGLPFTREHRFPRLGDVTHEQMEKALRLQASQARRALSRVADRWSVHWTFRVVRGRVTPEVLAAALEADLLTVGKSSRPLSRHSRLGSTARALVEQTPRSILLAQPSSEENRPILVTYDGTPQAEQTLLVAVHLAQANQLPITIFVLGNTPEETQHAAARAATWLTEHQPHPDTIKYMPLLHPNAYQLAEAVRRAGGGTLVLSGFSPSLQAHTLQTLLDELDCPVLVVR